jgi:glucokinase
MLMIAVFWKLVNKNPKIFSGICYTLSMKNYIVADIGGTQIRAALFNSESQTPVTVTRITTQGSDGSPLERLLNAMASTWPQGQSVEAVCVAAPGYLDPYQGIIFEAPNIPGWVDMPMKKYLEERFKVPAAVGNDANLAALGEWKFGAGRGHHTLIYLTVSTGIGGGVIINDQLLLGVHGLAAELGHITVIPEGPLCGCGQRGHLEAIASGPAIARWVEEEIQQGVPSILTTEKPITAKEVSMAASKGDELSIAALARAGTYLGQAVANYLHIFNPSAVIFGGGVSRSGSFLFDPMKSSLQEHILSPQYLKDLTLTTAALGDNVGLLGALALAQTLSKP